MKKKICFLIGNLDNSGGTERVTSIIANELIKFKEYEIHILSLKNGLNPFFDLNPLIQINTLYTDDVSMKIHFIETIYKIRKFIKFYSINTLIVVDSISCIFTVPALFGLKVNHICWEHFNFKVNLGTKFRDLGRILAAKYCNHIVTLTQKDKEFWEKHLSFIKINKITPIHNPIINRKKCFDLEHKQNYKNILAIGRLSYQKGFDLLLEAWALVCKENLSWNLRIIGSGDCEFALKKLAKDLQIESYVEFIPHTKNINYYYETSSIYCLSSRFEGFPMVLLEALSFDLPIVSFDCDTGPREMIQHHENGLLVSPLNIYELKNSLLKIMTIPADKYKEYCINSQKIKNNFYIENIITKWISIL